MPFNEPPLTIDRQYQIERSRERRLVILSCVIALLSCATGAMLAVVVFSIR